jgi:hypothetical protein
MEWPGRIESVEEVDIETAVLHLEGEAIPVRAIRSADPESVARATRGFNEKYADSRYLHTMVRPEIEPTTVRLDPR